MSHNITVQGGSSVRLPTAGKYCDRDIVITAEGGKEDLNDVLAEQEALIDELKTVLQGKVNGSQEEVILQSKTITPSKSVQEVTADEGHTALEKVTVEAIPSEYIIPSGTKTITGNGTHDAKAFELVSVNVPIPDGYIQPSGTLEVTENGTHDVTAYASVNVNVPTGGAEPDPRDQYQRVEYIESAEEETYPYIITDFYADNDSGVEVVASFAVMQDRIPMGSRLDSGSTRFYCVYPLSTTSCYYGFNIGSSISCSTKVNTKYRLQTNFMNSRQAIIYEANGTRKAFATFSQTLSEHTVPVSIFGYNSASGGTVTSKREYRLYSARLSHGFDIVREYIPCYRKSDGVVGVYEKFTGQFLTTEVGAFAKGENVEWGE